MRVSEYYKLGVSQPSLDFVDVNVNGDIEVYIDPRAVRLLQSEWGDECVALIQNFFHVVIKAIQNGDHEKAKKLLRELREPNETHLGQSRGKARGHALGNQSSNDVWEALTQSEAASSGLLEDLEDTVLMVEGIAKDIVSDITTNLIRGPLITYTQRMCAEHGIPCDSQVASGPLWDPGKKSWYTKFVELPVTDNNKLLLVPKIIVRKRMDYQQDEYYRHYLLEYLKEVELSANSELVQTLKDGKTRKVTKKDLIKKYGEGKAVIVKITREHPDILQRYREAKRGKISAPLSHREIAEVSNTDAPKWDDLLANVRDINPGRDEASDYEENVEQLLSAIFYPNLTNPQVQHPIHDGRKRIDITYTNMAQSGFFAWLGAHYPSANIFVECKNYSGEIGNPELDQLSSRYSPRRGQVGILICRNFDNKEKFLKRCRDTADDERGYIIALDDCDLANIVEERTAEDELPGNFHLLHERFSKLIH